MQRKAEELRARGYSEGARAAFSLLELLLVISVTVLLLGLLSPALRYARESARQVACASNLRQLGYGVAMFLDDHQDRFPHTVFSTIRQNESLKYEEMMAVNVISRDGVPQWDGLGQLFASKYVPDGQVFYCPSHYSDHSFIRYEQDWAQPGSQWIYGNFHYRGVAPPINGEKALPISRTKYETLLRLPVSVTLAADGLRTRFDYNHIVGNSMLKLDLSVQWFADPGTTIYRTLPETPTGGGETIVSTVWRQMDSSDPRDDFGGDDGGGGGAGANLGGAMRVNRDRRRGN